MTTQEILEKAIKDGKVKEGNGVRVIHSGICILNANVVCNNAQCEHCGWNPEEFERRQYD